MKIGYQLVNINEMLTECKAVFTSEDESTLYGYTYYTKESGLVQQYGIKPTTDPQKVMQMFIETIQLIEI